MTALCVLAGLGTAALRATAGDAVQPTSPHLETAALFLGVVAVAVLGTLIVDRAPANRIGWSFLVVALALAVGGAAETYVAWADAAGPEPRPGAAAIRVIAGGNGIVVWAALLALLLSFPDGGPPPGRWRWVVPFAALAVAAQAVMAARAALGHTIPEELAGPLWLAYVTALLLSAATLVARYRRARGIERQQLRWIALSGVLVMAGVVVQLVPVFLPRSWPVSPYAGVGLVGVGLASLPIAATVAITRYRLYDLDRLVTRSVAYGTAVVLVAVLFRVSILGLHAAIPAAQGSDLTVAVATLAAAGAFAPAQRHLRLRLDRRFHRARYDADRVIAGVEAHLRDEVSEAALLEVIRRTVAVTFRPAVVDVWVRPPAVGGVERRS